jgi:branched-chain amino acid transport system substrate-binding protein
MNFSYLVCGLIMSASLLPMATIAAEAGVTDSTILVGTSIVTSGPLGSLGAGIRDGTSAYFEHVNRSGGIAGRKIEFTAMDDAYKVERTVANITQLIRNDKVFALLGLTGTPNVLAAIPLAAEARVPLFAPFTGADILRNRHNRYVFNVTASYSEELEKIVEHITTFGITKIAVAYLENDFGKGGLASVEASVKRRGLAIAAAAAVAPDSADVGAGVVRLRQANPQVVIMVTAGKVTADFIAAYKKQSRNTQFYCLSVISNTQMAQIVGDEARGIAVSQTMPFPWSTGVDVVREYQNVMKSLNRQDYSYASLQGFVSAKIFVEGLRRAGRDITREKFISALEGMNRVDIGGYMVSFSPANHNGSQYVDLTVLARSGKFFR